MKVCNSAQKSLAFDCRGVESQRMSGCEGFKRASISFGRGTRAATAELHIGGQLPVSLPKIC